MDEWFNSVDDWVVLVLSTALLLGAAECGVVVAHWQKRRHAGDADRFLTTVAAPTIGLLALMIGFTFAMVLTRFEVRVADVVDAANGIGKVALRAHLLPEPYRSEAPPLIKEYTTLRVAHAGAEIASPAMAADRRRSEAIQDKLWDMATAAAAANPQVVPTGLFIEALNDMIDGYQKRLAAGRNSVPSVILLALQGIAMIAVGFSGYGAHWGTAYSRGAMWAMSLLIAGVLTLVVDLNTPQAGLIAVNQQPLLDVLGTMK